MYLEFTRDSIMTIGIFFLVYFVPSNVAKNEFKPKFNKNSVLAQKDRKITILNSSLCLENENVFSFFCRSTACRMHVNLWRCEGQR